MVNVKGQKGRIMVFIVKYSKNLVSSEEEQTYMLFQIHVVSELQVSVCAYTYADLGLPIHLKVQT